MPVFEFSTIGVLHFLWHLGQRLLKAYLIDVHLGEVKLSHIQPVHAWEVRLWAHDSLELLGREAELANLLVITLDDDSGSIIWIILHSFESRRQTGALLNAPIVVDAWIGK